MESFSKYLNQRKTNNLFRDAVILSEKTNFPLVEFTEWYFEEGYMLSTEDILEGWGSNLGKWGGRVAGGAVGGLGGAVAGGLGGMAVGNPVLGGIGSLGLGAAGGTAGWQKGGEWGEKIGKWLDNLPQHMRKRVSKSPDPLATMQALYDKEQDPGVKAGYKHALDALNAQMAQSQNTPQTPQNTPNTTPTTGNNPWDHLANYNPNPTNNPSSTPTNNSAGPSANFGKKYRPNSGY